MADTSQSLASSQGVVDEDEIVDVQSHATVVKVDVFVHAVAVRRHEVDVRLLPCATVDVLHRQHAHVDLAKRDRSQNMRQKHTYRLRRESNKNSSGDEIANVNFYAVRP